MKLRLICPSSTIHKIVQNIITTMHYYSMAYGRKNRNQHNKSEVAPIRVEGISHQVVVGEPRDLLLDAVLHLGLRRQGCCVVE